MSIDAEVTISFFCDGCKKTLEEHHIGACFCTKCKDSGPIDDPKLKKGEPIRQWADRQKLLGRITDADEELLLRLARDLDDARAARAA